MNFPELRSSLSIPLEKYHQSQGQSNDCGPTAAAIAANAFWDEERYSGDVVARKMNKPAFSWRPFPHPVFQRIPDWATFPWGIVYYLRSQKVPSRWFPFASLSRLRRNLESGRITIVLIGEVLRWDQGRFAGWSHYKLPYGYSSARGYLFVDPAVNRADSIEKEIPQGVSWQPEEQFLQQWRNLLQVMIEVG